MKPAEILRELNKLPNKKYGQNFLTDEKVLADIVEAADVQANDTLVEIGPGLGALTFELAKKAKKVIAIEADRELAEFLRAKNVRNLTVVTGDALQVDWTATITGEYKIVANIPYSITSPLLQKIYRLDRQPDLMVLLVQKELAERLTAPPGNRDRGFMTVLGEANAQIKIVRKVKPGSFHPVPKVESAVIAIKLLPQNQTGTIFWPAVEAGFRHARQTLMNGLKDLPIPRPVVAAAFERLNLKPLARPSDLTFQQWQQLSRTLEKFFQRR